MGSKFSVRLPRSTNPAEPKKQRKLLVYHPSLECQKRVFMQPAASYNGVLKVWKVTGQHLAAEDWFSNSSDPYFILKYPAPHSEYKSPKFKHELNPEWSNLNIEHNFAGYQCGISSFTFYCSNASVFTIELWDYELIGSDDLIGSATFNMSQLASFHWKSDEFFVEVELRAPKKTDFRGKVRVYLYLNCPALLRDDLYSQDQQAVQKALTSMGKAIEFEGIRAISYVEGQDLCERYFQLLQTPSPVLESAFNTFGRYLSALSSMPSNGPISMQLPRVLQTIDTCASSPQLRGPMLQSLIPYVVTSVPVLEKSHVFDIVADNVSLGAADSSALEFLSGSFRLYTPGNDLYSKELSNLVMITGARVGTRPYFANLERMVMEANMTQPMHFALLQLCVAAYATTPAIGRSDVGRFVRFFRHALFQRQSPRPEYGAWAVNMFNKAKREMNVPLDENQIFFGRATEMPRSTYEYWFALEPLKQLIGAAPDLPVDPSSAPGGFHGASLVPSDPNDPYVMEGWIPLTIPPSTAGDRDPILGEFVMVNHEDFYQLQRPRYTAALQLPTGHPFLLAGGALLLPRRCVNPATVVQIFAADRLPDLHQLSSFDGADSANLFFSLPAPEGVHPVMYLDARTANPRAPGRFRLAVNNSYPNKCRYVIVRMYPLQPTYSLCYLSLFGYCGNDVPMPFTEFVSYTTELLGKLPDHAYYNETVDEPTPEELAGLQTVSGGGANEQERSTTYRVGGTTYRYYFFGGRWCGYSHTPISYRWTTPRTNFRPRTGGVFGHHHSSITHHHHHAGFGGHGFSGIS